MRGKYCTAVVALSAALMVAACSQEPYAKAVQNQMVNADDEQGGKLIQLQNEVDSLKANLTAETAARMRDDNALHTLALDVDAEVHANQNLAEAQRNQASGGH